MRTILPVVLAVHPHMRGADFRMVPQTPNCRLVHPHMRGADGQGIGNGFWTKRFIPTCVGQIMADNSKLNIKDGSSPHAWGRCLPTQEIHNPNAVHPHMRGADLTKDGWHIAPHRFIPTCVGQISHRHHPSASVCGSSPHAWGRSSIAHSLIISIAGSSPHAWGRFALRLLGVGQMNGSSPHAWGRSPR